MGSFSFRVAAEESRTRLDHFLVRHCPDLTRSRIRKLIDEGLVLVDGAAPKAGVLLQAGADVRVTVPPPEPSTAAAEEIPLSILFEDDQIIVLDKPPHMVVHPAFGHSGGTLVNALLHHCRDLSGVGGVARPGIVHRLDKGTSGVMVAAKTDRAHLALSAQFKAHTIGRTYLAAVRGRMSRESGTIDRPLGRHPSERKTIAVRPGGRRAVTVYRTLASRSGVSLLELVPGTGRTHQLRVHLSSLGHPILGDATYGGGAKGVSTRDADLRNLLKALDRPALHALALELDHPVTGDRVRFSTPPPPDLADLFSWIKAGP